MLGVVDPCRVSVGECIASATVKWSGQPGNCENIQYYTKCKFSQAKGWQRNNMATWERGLAAAREYCMQDAENYGAAGAQTALMWGWQYCFMFFEGESCPKLAKEASGFYSEAKFSAEGDEALDHGSDEANYNYCMIGPEDKQKSSRRRRSSPRRRRSRSRSRRRR